MKIRRLLFIAGLFSCFSPLAGCKSNIPTSNGLMYNLNETEDGYIVWAGEATKHSTNIKVPAVYNELPVVGVRENGFYSSGIKEISLPETITWIGEGAFGSTNLKTFKVPSKVTVLPKFCFYLCPNLSSITFNGNLLEIGEAAFGQCPELKEINIPDHLIALGKSAFCRTGLASIDIPSNIKVIPEQAFEGCGNLKSVTFHEGLVSIGREAFYRCDLKNISLPNSLTYLDEYAFEMNAHVETAIIGEGIKEIPKGCFSFCDIKYVQLGKHTETISEYAFDSCQLESMFIPSGIKSIGRNNFSEYQHTFSTVYYGGETKAEADHLRVLAAKPGNERFDLVDIYCYSEEKPESSGYWHFVNGMPELWVVE